MISKYFGDLEKGTLEAYKLANKARQKGYDPDTKPEIVLAKNLAERVVGLISVVAPQIRDTGAIARIEALEKQHGVLDWRVAFEIALEVAQEKFCKFESKREAMEVGVRVGFSYVTLGAVSAPLEGFTKLHLKQRLDGQGEYFCLDFAGPVRAAGGTAAAVCVLIADYVRVKMGYLSYDPSEAEVRRCHAEITDYHEWVTNLQYFPSKEEMEFLVAHMPVEISGDPSEKYEISNVNLKDIPRTNTNRIRSGYCLMYSSALPLKAPKVWAKLSKWAKDFSMDHWGFLDEFLKIQKQAKAKEAKESKKDSKIKPDYTYIADLVAGRPVFGYPLRSGGFRLRYGRGRTSGYSAQSIHPATMVLLNEFIALGTQLKVERPGKAAAFTSCDTIDGPIVKLKDGSVVCVDDVKQAKELRPLVEEVLYNGDVLINYGDFFDRAHPLVPSGYVPEEWILELEQSCVSIFGTFDLDKISDIADIDPEKLSVLFNRPLSTKISVSAALHLSKAFNIPLHPSMIFYWSTVSAKDVLDLMTHLSMADFDSDLVMPPGRVKRTLELIGIEHRLDQSKIVIAKDKAKALFANLGASNIDELKMHLSKAKQYEDGSALSLVNAVSDVKIMDKCGTFIGARMGRPEKAKIRKLTSSPHVLFPVGTQGGKYRSFQSALEKGQITSQFAPFYCKYCDKETVFSVCEVCDRLTEQRRYCEKCGLLPLDISEQEEDDAQGNKVFFHVVKGMRCSSRLYAYKTMSTKIGESFPKFLSMLGTNIFPDLIKGVRGTSNKDHIPEHPVKGILRAKHGIYVNKDGTIRYDCSEVPITHFKPQEIGVPASKLRALGYEKDIDGEILTREDQILEIFPQDIVLPCCPSSPEEPADEILFRTCHFVDDLLVRFYRQKPFYKLASKQDLVGQLAIGLAPHTSAGTVCRIIGFSKTQGFLAHPYIHAAMRRDCDGDEGCILLLMDALLNFSKRYLPESRGSTMDAPLVLTYILNPAEVDDMVFNLDIAWKYPLALYRSARQFKMPWDVKVSQVSQVLRTPAQYQGMGFTHDTSDINEGVLCSAYKLLPSMEDKLKSQMELAERIRAVEASDVARLVIDKHFMKDTKGNLRKFSQQEFRCVECNEKFRRPPLVGKCTECGGKILFTVSEGFVVKYLELSRRLAEKYRVSTYMRQTLELLQVRVESVFGKEQDRQEGLAAFISS